MSCFSGDGPAHLAGALAHLPHQRESLRSRFCSPPMLRRRTSGPGTASEQMWWMARDDDGRRTEDRPDSETRGRAIHVPVATVGMWSHRCPVAGTEPPLTRAGTCPPSSEPVSAQVSQACSVDRVGTCSDPSPCTHGCTQAGGRWRTSMNAGGRQVQVAPTRRTSADIGERTALSS